MTALRRSSRSVALIAPLSFAMAFSAPVLADEASSAVLGQSGSNGRGQSGSNGRAVTIADVFGQSGSNGRALRAGAMGTIERIDSSAQGSAIVVLGQQFPIGTEALSAIAIGDYVLVTLGQADSAATLQKLETQYVAGVSPVALLGTVERVDTNTASFTVGGVAVDYSSQLTLDPSLAPATGGAYEVVGIQPTAGGIILAGLQSDAAVVSLSLQP